MSARMAMGEARFDSRGLAINDYSRQNWSLRIGEVSREIALAEEGDREGFARWQEDMQDTDPVFGVFWSIDF